MDIGMAEETYDISVLLGKENIDYPEDTPYSRKIDSKIGEGGSFNLSTLVMSAHSGTHLDAPYHIIAEGKTIDEYPASDFILSALVVQIEGKHSIETEDLNGVEIESGEALLFKTFNSLSGISRSGEFSDKCVYMSGEAADICVQKGAALVGIDYISIDRCDDDEAPAHRKLLGNGVPILEGINLEHVPPGRYTLICLPLKVEGGDGSPVRAVLVR
jgi:arylformamidase